MAYAGLVIVVCVLCVNVVFGVDNVAVLGPADLLITTLPGLNTEIAFHQYSGYLNGGGDVRLFFW